MTEMSIPPLALRCDLCSSLLHRAVRTPCCQGRACRGCCIKFITRNRKCWGCDNNIKTHDLINHVELRQAVENYSAVKPLSKDVVSDSQVNSGTKRDSQGEEKEDSNKTSNDDQRCTTVKGTRLYPQVCNVLLVKLSLEADSEARRVRIDFSREFISYLRSQSASLYESSSTQRTEVINHQGESLSLVHVNLNTAASGGIFLSPGFHIANYSQLESSSVEVEVESLTFDMKVSSSLSVSSSPTLCEVVLSSETTGTLEPQPDLDTVRLSVTEFSCPSLELLQCGLCLEKSQQLICWILVKSRVEGNVLLSPGQYLGKVSNTIRGTDIEAILNLHDCSNEEPKDKTKLSDCLDLNTRKKLAEKEKLEGNKLFEEGLYSQASQKYSAAIEMLDSSPVLYSNRAACYLQLDLPCKALEDALMSVKIDPSYVKGWVRAVRSCLILGQVFRARQMCQNITQISPNLSSVIDLELEKLKQIEISNTEFLKESGAGNLSQALFHLDKIALLCPQFEKNHRFRAELRAMKGDLKISRNIIETNLGSCEETVDVMYTKALLLYYEDNFDQAASELRKIISLDSEHKNAEKLFRILSELKVKKDAGNALFKEEKYEEALELYKEALQLDKCQRRVNAKLHCNRAACCTKLGRMSEAIEECSAAIKNDDQYQKAFLRRAQAFMETENFDQAVNDYKQLRLLDRANQEYVKLLGEAETKLAQSKDRDLYSVLGVARDAGVEEIKRAYRKAALCHHPDRHAVADLTIKNFHVRKFKEVGEAYSVLSDPARRSLYDQGQLYKTIQAQHSMAQQEMMARAVAAAAAARIHRRPVRGAGLFGHHPGVRAGLHQGVGAGLHQGVGAGLHQGMGAGLAGIRPGYVFVRPAAPGQRYHFVNISNFPSNLSSHRRFH